MKRFFGLIALLSVLSFSVFSSEMGYVDIQQVVDGTKIGQGAKARFQNMVKAEQKRLKSEEAALEQMRKNYLRDQAVMSDKQRADEEAKIKTRLGVYQKMVADAKKKVGQQNAQVGEELLKPAGKIIEQLAKEKKLKVVFTRRQAAFLYLDESINLTGEVIKRLDALK
ncbi:MAG: OmpH family outer membrane protein [Gammaproteobacteria bacterium]|nr:OmpH family outer membrane protein [Gammaproteobacteria bacterium]